MRDADPVLAAELERVLVRPTTRAAPSCGRTRPGRACSRPWCWTAAPPHEPESRFDDNYAFFRSQVHADEAPRIWRGLQKLEHVSITLGAAANAQQIFESLNSTGEPLRDHELIHNYVLMGLSHAEQQRVEEEFWLPIEQNTGEAIGAFWRHLLIMTTGREVSVDGEHGVYGAFRREFPGTGLDDLRRHAQVWREFSEIYRILLDPAQEQDPEIRRQLDLREHVRPLDLSARAERLSRLRARRDLQGRARADAGADPVAAAAPHRGRPRRTTGWSRGCAGRGRGGRSSCCTRSRGSRRPTSASGWP